MLTMNDKIELKRESQAIKSGYNIVEVDRTRFSDKISTKGMIFLL